jgi:16S rRNA (cytosine967-C5)-methyltransferase
MTAAPATRAVRSGGRVAPARRVAFDVVRRVFEQDAYADRALRAEADRARLDSRDRALAMRLAYGTVQRRATLDHLITVFAGRPVDRLDPAVVAALRLGLFQLLLLEGVADHAAVDQSVELAKEAGRGGHTLVNAVLRRAAREGEGLLAQLTDATPGAAALLHSHPEWVARMWWEALGPDAARALLAADNEPAETALRVNALVAEPAAVADRLPVPSHPAEAIPEGLVLEAPYDAHGSELWEQGAIMPQSRASMLVARVVDPQPGERLLDLCAAPGGKTTHLAALTGGEARITAVERHAGRAAALRANCERLRAHSVTVEVAEAELPRRDGPYDRVLVDPPCSALGTLRSRPDARWRAGEARLAELEARQAAILDAGLSALRPGGVLVYSTCTISPRENELLIAAALERHPDVTCDDLSPEWPLWQHPSVPSHLLTLPHRDGTDGFFIARLRRA